MPTTVVACNLCINAPSRLPTTNNHQTSSLITTGSSNRTCLLIGAARRAGARQHRSDSATQQFQLTVESRQRNWIAARHRPASNQSPMLDLDVLSSRDKHSRAGPPPAIHTIRGSAESSQPTVQPHKPGVLNGSIESR